jgi:DNA-directed RNA polymerase specialized sigma24 family protein
MSKQEDAASSSDDCTFPELVATHAAAARAYAGHLVRRNGCLSTCDADDLYNLGLMKVWQAYFRSGAKQRYEHRGDTSALRLIKVALKTAAADLQRQRIRERTQIRTLELDAPLPDGGSLGEMLRVDDFTDWTDFWIDFEHFVDRELSGGRQRQIVAELCGLGGEPRRPNGATGAHRAYRCRVRGRLKLFLYTYFEETATVMPLARATAKS